MIAFVLVAFLSASAPGPSLAIGQHSPRGLVGVGIALIPTIPSFPRTRESRVRPRCSATRADIRRDGTAPASMPPCTPRSGCQDSGFPVGAGNDGVGREAIAAAPTAEVEQAAAEALAEAWPRPEARAEVRVVRLSGGAESAAPPVRVRFLGAEAPRGQASAEVETQATDGTWARAGWALLHVAWFETAAVLTRDVPRGEAIGDAWRLEEIETTTLTSPLLAPDALGAAAWTAARTLRAGTPLTTRDAAAPVAADRGEPVRVTYARGPIRIELAAEARERGSVGDIVRVYCSDTRATLRVRLTAPGQGEWVSTL